VTVPFGIAIYFVIWWVVLFAVLPFGLRTQQEEGKVTPGTPPSAPARTRALRVIVITSLLTGAIFATGYVAFTYKFIDLRPPPLPALPQLNVHVPT